jgi:integrase
MEDMTIHDLRRTCASHLAISGENLPTIQNVLNHVLNHIGSYLHLSMRD